MDRRRLLFLVLATLVAWGGTAEAQEQEIRESSPVCKVPGQLVFFIGPSVMDLFEEDAPESARVYPEGHPSKRASVVGGEDAQTVTKGKKALDLGDCQRGADLEGATVEVVEDCTNLMPFPNGGCRKVRISGLSPAEWYTFGEALEEGNSQDGPGEKGTIW